LFSSLARCSVSLRTLWAYGFDSAAQRALEKLRLVKLTLMYFLIIERQKSLIHSCLSPPACGQGQTGMFLKINA